MNLRQELDKLNTLLARAQKALILLPSNPDTDSTAAGLGLYLGLLKQGKQAIIASSSGVRQEDRVLTGADNIKTSLDGKDTVISLPYREGEIETVTSYVEEGKLNIVVKPQNKELHFAKEDISVYTAGIEADIIFTVGIKNLQSAGGIYEQNKDSFTGKEIVNLDNSFENGNFGTVNIVNAKLPTVSEIVVLVLKNIKVIMDTDIATNLYNGLKAGTDNFNPDKASALTFEAAALCLRSGAKRGNIAENRKILQKAPAEPTKPQQEKPVENSKQTDGEKNNIPPEWLRPKIFTPSGKP